MTARESASAGPSCAGRDLTGQEHSQLRRRRLNENKCRDRRLYDFIMGTSERGGLEGGVGGRVRAAFLIARCSAVTHFRADEPAPCRKVLHFNKEFKSLVVWRQNEDNRRNKKSPNLLLQTY